MYNIEVKKFIIWVLVLISLAAVLFKFSDKWAEIFFGIKKTSGVAVFSVPSEATVFINNIEVGKTPYEAKNMDIGEYVVKIEKNGAFWEGKVRLNPGTVTFINRDLASDSASSAGEVLTLEKGKGLTLISNPSDAEVEIDGKKTGKTPLTIETETGDHTILVSRQNYLNRSIRANLPSDFNLTIALDLGLLEVDLTSVTTPAITQTPEVVVKNTPTGFLRVRDKPSLSGKEITQVKPGDKLILLEELGAWDRVRLSDQTEGFVSTAYVEKVENKNP